MSDVFTAITHHPSRRQFLSDITKSVDIDYVSKDKGNEGCWGVSKRAWMKAINSQAEWGLVLQDDIIPVDRLQRLIEELIETSDDSVICLSCMDSPRRRDAVDNGADWIEFRYSTWGQGILMPTEVASKWINWCDTYVPEKYSHYDTRLTWWLQERRDPCSVPVPNLVQHRKCKSIMGHVGHRQSVEFKKDFNAIEKLTKNPKILRVSGSPIDSRYDYTSLKK